MKNITETRTITHKGNTITYTLARKQVKNVNLRVRPNGVFVSAPSSVPTSFIDDFVTGKLDFIAKAQQHFALNPTAEKVKRLATADEIAMISQMAAQIYPLFKEYNFPMPQIKTRDMKSRWGSCQTKKYIITLSTRLLDKPRPSIEYVLLHEFCHFVHPDHSKRFHALVTTLMPDWQSRKSPLQK